MLTPEQIDELIKEIFDGTVNIENLPRDLYREVSEHLFKGVEEGYGKTLEVAFHQEGDYEILKSFQENIYRFSAAKTFQQVYETQQKIFDEDGFKRSFSDFKNDAKVIYDEFNENYLKTEFNTAISQAQAAEDWQTFEEQKHVLPYLTWRGVMDDRERDSHVALEGMTAPVDDPIWNEYTPPIDWNDRCILEQTSDESLLTSPEDLKGMKKETPVNENFAFNPGKTHTIFSDHHPYFNVPEKYEELKKNNFNLPLPE